MTSDAVDQRSPRPLLTLGRVDLARVQVGYRAEPDGPVYQQFLIDLPVPDSDTVDGHGTVDETEVLARLEPVLRAAGGAPRHYSVHSHRWHTSWGASPGSMEIGVLVTAGTKQAALSPSWVDTVTRAFRDLLDLVGPPAPGPVTRDEAVLRARRSVASAYSVAADDLSVSAEEHHHAEGSWTIGLRSSSGEEFDVLVGLVDGYARSVRVVHADPSEVFDSVGAE